MIPERPYFPASSSPPGRRSEWSALELAGGFAQLLVVVLRVEDRLWAGHTTVDGGDAIRIGPRRAVVATQLLAAPRHRLQGLVEQDLERGELLVDVILGLDADLRGAFLGFVDDPLPLSL